MKLPVSRSIAKRAMRLFVWASGVLLLVRHTTSGSGSIVVATLGRRSPRARTGTAGKGGGAIVVRGGNSGLTATPPPPTPLKRLGRPLPVPNIVHYVFGLDPVGIMPFGILQYLSIIGSVLYVRPDEIRWHHKYTPQDESSRKWWACSLPHITLTPVEPVTEMNGRPLPNLIVQYQSDIIRLRLMNETGGIYFDTDIIPLRSFDELRTFEFLMGKEGDRDDALCPAVLVGAPRSRFIQRWWAAYDTFDPKGKWAYHGVRVPALLQHQAPDECIVLGNRAFFTPNYGSMHELHEKDDGYNFRENYALHMWATAHDGYRASFSKLTIADIFVRKGSFHRIARKLLVEALAAGLLCDFARNETVAAVVSAAATPAK
jgi:hypothetical protein